jgi:hypothetical protein
LKIPSSIGKIGLEGVVKGKNHFGHLDFGALAILPQDARKL